MRVASVCPRRSWHVRYASDSDRPRVSYRIVGSAISGPQLTQEPKLLARKSPSRRYRRPSGATVREERTRRGGGVGRPGLIQNNSGLPKDLASPPWYAECRGKLTAQRHRFLVSGVGIRRGSKPPCPT